MTTHKYTFVGHQFGEFEGTKYDNIILSDGVRAFKCKNKTGETKFNLVPEQDEVTVDFEIKGGKNDLPQVVIIGLSAVKPVK